MFIKYQHVERLWTIEVEWIEVWTCYVFPKLDGSNWSIWNSEWRICCGSRNQELSEQVTNQWFWNYVQTHSWIITLLKENPNIYLYWEWLIPHTFKKYIKDAWRKFYVFDVFEKLENWEFKVLKYEDYQILLEKYQIEYIPPLAIVTNADHERLLSYVENATYLVEDTQRIWEWIVIKNYDFVNRYWRTTWAKVVISEFRTANIKVFWAPKILLNPIESRIVDKYVTEAEVEKTLAKIKINNWEFNSRNIPELLHRVFHDLVQENSWEFVKTFKNPTVNFKTLNSYCIKKIKEIKPNLFN